MSQQVIEAIKYLVWTVLHYHINLPNFSAMRIYTFRLSLSYKVSSS